MNGEWKCLGEELSALLEAASISKYPKVVLYNYLIFDMKAMAATAPMFAPLKRMTVPTVALQCQFSGKQRTCYEFNLTAKVIYYKTPVFCGH